MKETMLAKLIEHNNWANLLLIEACLKLTEEQLDATPLPTSEWSIRHTLTHFVTSQHGYLSLLTLPPEQRQRPTLELNDLETSVRRSGEGFLAFALDSSKVNPDAKIPTTDGYLVEPWVVVVQTVTHAAEHRRQICRMLRILGATPPDLDAWTFGEMTGALVPNDA